MAFWRERRADNGVEGFPSGQREQTVNLSATPSEVRILPPPPTLLFVGLHKRRPSCGPARAAAALLTLLAWRAAVGPGGVSARREQSLRRGAGRRVRTFCAGIAQLAEHQPSKLRVAGSRPVSRSIDDGEADHRVAPKRWLPFFILAPARWPPSLCSGEGLVLFEGTPT